MSKKEIRRVVAVLCLAVVVAVVCGCASSKKPKPANPYKGMMSDRGNVPPAYSEPAGPQSLKAAPASQTATVPAPTDDFETEGAYLAQPEEEAGFAIEEEDGTAEAHGAAFAPEGAEETPPAAAPAAAPKQNFPVVANGKVPSSDLAGKGASRKGGSASTGKAGTAAAGTVTAGGTYVVKSGDILGRIANAHNVKVSDIKALNPGINPDKLLVNQKLVMPAGATNLDANANAGATAKASGGTGSPSKKGREPIPADGLYTVVANDSLWKISDRFGVSVSDIRTWNGLTSDRLKIGQQLRLRGEGGEAAPKADNAPKTDGPVEAAAPNEGGAAAVEGGPVVVEGSAGGEAPPVAEANVRVMEYFVCEGDTIDSICTAAEILRDDFLQANPAVRSDADLKVGMPVRLIMR